MGANCVDDTIIISSDDEDEDPSSVVSIECDIYLLLSLKESAK